MYESILDLNSQNDGPTLIIDLDNVDYRALHFSEISPFQVDEIKSPCPVYPTGVFPGATDLSSDKQRSYIQCFDNCLEFSKIMDDDCLLQYSEQYLTTKFFERRHKGWLANHFQKKDGKAHLGYFINGLIYHPEDYHEVYQIVYGIIYYHLINQLPIFKQLIENIQTSKTVILQSFNRDLLTGILYAVYADLHINQQPKIDLKN